MPRTDGTFAQELKDTTSELVQVQRLFELVEEAERSKDFETFKLFLKEQLKNAAKRK